MDELAWVARTVAGARLCSEGQKVLGGRLYFHRDLAGWDGASPFTVTKTLLRRLHREGATIVAVLASGIVIRCLAEVLHDKRREPAVLIIDEGGQFVIPILGGHHGVDWGEHWGGNALANEVARVLGATAVISTASEARFGLALDCPPRGWTLLNPQNLAGFTTTLLNGAPLRLRGLSRDTEWLSHIPNLKDRKGAKSVLTIYADSWSQLLKKERLTAGETTLVYGVGELALGLGAAKDCPDDEMDNLVKTSLESTGIPASAIKIFATWQGKLDEPAIRKMSNKQTLYTFSSAALRRQTSKVSQRSEVVATITGAPAVAEAAALAALGEQSELLLTKQKSKAATCAIACAPCAPPIEAAIPPLPSPKGNHHGILAVLGLGPGMAEWCTHETLTLLAESEDWIGYHGYLKRLLPRAGERRLHGFELGEERERAELALELASSGGSVALISSGDPGIYAMASPLFEMLDKRKGRKKPQIVVSPGLSALQAVSARLGAPIGHDFCAISLSDLLTPASVIRKRLRAAVRSDFVIALYNPAAKKRRKLLDEAIDIARAHHSDDTPAVIARAVGHTDEKIIRTTLGKFDSGKVDMRCLVLIGNSQTKRTGRWLYTPRGYDTKS
ncbi:MAG: precorrin-3B C(17)-methyltransferase [Alphaproteobacteria bacterium]